MEQKGGCCIARFPNGGTTMYNMSNVDKIMLKFRPIAPKPVSTATNSSISSSISPDPSPKATRRGKRSRISSKESFNKRGKKTNKSSSEDSEESTVVVKTTLSLLPEVITRKIIAAPTHQSYPQWLSFGGGVDPTVEIKPRREVVSSWVKVECLWVGDVIGWVGCTDQERVMGLDGDTCPGFVSDGLNNVRWMNEAYKRMVHVGSVDDVEVVASVLMGEGVVLPVGCAAFTCRVRVVTCGTGKENKGGCNKTVPCDVWRMDCGGFAWRLDTKAALSLASTNW